VTRVGPFSVFTSDTAQFLDYRVADSESAANAPLLAKLPSQPGGQISSAAKEVASAGAGELSWRF